VGDAILGAVPDGKVDDVLRAREPHGRPRVHLVVQGETKLVLGQVETGIGRALA